MKFQGINNLEESILADKESKEEVLVEDSEEAIIEVKSNGKFQLFSLLLLIISFTCSGDVFGKAIQFMMKDVNFQCGENGNITICSREKACQKDINNSIIYQNETNYSWINDFKLDCSNRYSLYLFNVLYIVGSLLSSLFASSSSDYFGRIKIIKISMILRTLVLLIPIIFPYKIVTLISLLILGFLSTYHTIVSYILISEYVSRFEKDKYQTIMFICGALLSVLTGCFFYVYQNWRIYFLISLLYGLVFCLLSFKLLESPRYLISKHKFNDAREIFKKIAYINLGKEKKFKFEKEDKLAQKDRKKVASIYLDKSTTNGLAIPMSSLFFSEKYKYYSVALPFWFLSTSMIFVVLSYQQKELNFSLYFDQIILNGSEAIFLFVSLYLMIYLGKKHAMIKSYVIAIVCFLNFFFFRNIGQSTNIILILLTQFAYSNLLNIIYTMTNEYYSTDLRGRALAICIFAEKLGKFAGPVMEDIKYFVLIVSVVLSLISCIFLLPIENGYTNSCLIDNSEEENDD